MRGKRIRHRRFQRKRDGVILLIVLVTVVVMTLAAFTFSSLMQVEERASRVLARQVQSRYLVDSGVDYVRLFLAANRDEIAAQGGLWDNEGAFRGVPAAVDSTNIDQIGRFTVVAPAMNDDAIQEGYRFGLTDESSRINVNALPYMDNWQPGSGRAMLMALPEMTEEIADAILDWVDEDDDEREYGTESSWYGGQSPAYAAKNGPLDSLDELLLVRGVTPELIFGLDVNRNGVLDLDETVGTSASSLDSDLYLGWAAYLTLFSKESNLNMDGLKRININGENLDQLYDDLKSAFDDDWTNFIVQYRINGPSSAPGDDDTTGTAAQFPAALTDDTEGSYQFASVVDLMDAWVKVENDAGETVFIPSPINIESMGLAIYSAMKSLTVYEGESIPGRINIMQAPRRVMEGIPGLDSETLDQIIQVREFELDDPDFLDLNRNFETFLMTEFIVDVATMKQLMPFICVGGDVYGAEVVGYFSDGVGTSRAEAIFDTTLEVPRILAWRDKTHLQASWSVEILGEELAP